MKYVMRIESLLQNLKSEVDATAEFEKLKEGDNYIKGGPDTDMRMLVRVEKGKAHVVSIVDGKGKEVTNTIQMRACWGPPDTTSPIDVTCWDCAIDKQGNRHCWKIPCPVFDLLRTPLL
jgi:hypothetical protein